MSFGCANVVSCITWADKTVAKTVAANGEIDRNVRIIDLLRLNCYPAFFPGILLEYPRLMSGSNASGRPVLPLFGGSQFIGRATTMKPCNLHIEKTLKLVDEMICLADQGDTDREDNGCGILYGVLRDSAYKLKHLAENEKENHIRKGWWPGN